MNYLYICTNWDLEIYDIQDILNINLIGRRIIIFEYRKSKNKSNWKLCLYNHKLLSSSK